MLPNITTLHIFWMTQVRKSDKTFALLNYPGALRKHHIIPKIPTTPKSHSSYVHQKSTHLLPFKPWGTIISGATFLPLEIEKERFKM